MESTRRIQYGGLIVALSGFGLTRLFVAETLQVEDELPFLIVGMIPLVVGLLLTVYGVALAVGPFSSKYANTVARWHVLGIGVIAVVFAITAIDQSLRGGRFGVGQMESLFVANVLLGGAVGGTLTGIRSGKILHQRRELRRSANRALLVNRLLKHEVLNAITIISGHADLLNGKNDSRTGSMPAIQEAVRRIKSTIEEVGTITKNGDRAKHIDLAPIIDTEISNFESKYDIDVQSITRTTNTEIVGGEQVALVVRELLDNAAVHGKNVKIELREVPHALELSVIDDGPGLPDAQQALLEDDEFPEFDDPTAGFGLQIVRLVVVQFGGEIRVRAANEDGTGTTIAVTLPRSKHRELTAEAVGPSLPNVKQAIVGGILGGIAMGVFYQFSTGLLPVIGSLYGIHSPVIGWITHLFHSAVFGLLFAAAAVVPRIDRLVTGPMRSGLFGLCWGIVLWFVAAGIVMPVWLTVIGITTELPNLSVNGFIGHALWGVVLGVSYWTMGELDRIM